MNRIVVCIGDRRLLFAATLNLLFLDVQSNALLSLVLALEKSVRKWPLLQLIMPPRGSSVVLQLCRLMFVKS